MATPPDRDLGLRLPYMVFARRSGGGAPFSLIQSGMPPADPRLLGGPGGAPLVPDLGFAGPALLELEAGLARHLAVRPEQVVATVGASSAMLLVALALLRGGRVAAEQPSYQPLRALPGLTGSELRPFERPLEASSDGAGPFAVDPDRVRRALAGGSGPGHVLMTTPHNPSGAIAPPETLRELAKLAAEEGGYLVACEVYLEFAPPALRRERLPSAVQLAPNTVAIGSFTKAYGLGALRLGWVVLGEALLDRRAELEDAAFLDYVDPPTPILRMGLGALARLEELRAPYERLRAVSRPLLARWLAETPGVAGAPPEHGLIAFPRFEGVEDTLAFERRAVERHGVDFVPGEYFGLGGHGRIGFGLEPDVLAEALERLSRALAEERGA